MDDATNAPKILENKDIQALLPHRYPFLLVDRIVDILPDGAGGTGIKNVTANEPQFEYRVTRKNRKRSMYWFRGEAFVDGQLVAEAEVGAMITAV